MESQQPAKWVPQPKDLPTGLALVRQSFGRAVRDTCSTLYGLYKSTITFMLPAAIFLVLFLGWVLPLYGWPVPYDLWGPLPRTLLQLGLYLPILVVPLFIYCLIRAPLLIKLDMLVKPRLELFIDDPGLSPFRQIDPTNAGVEIRRIGVRAATLQTIHNVEVRVAERIPPTDIDIVEPLEIQRGALPWGRDVRPDQPIYAQIVAIGTLPAPPPRTPLSALILPSPFLGSSGLMASDSSELPEVRIHYSHQWGPRLLKPLPCGQWDLRIVAASEESPPAEAYIRLTVTDAPDPGERVTIMMIDKMGGEPLPPR